MFLSFVVWVCHLLFRFSFELANLPIHYDINSCRRCTCYNVVHGLHTWPTIHYHISWFPVRQPPPETFPKIPQSQPGCQQDYLIDSKYWAKTAPKMIPSMIQNMVPHLVHRTLTNWRWSRHQVRMNFTT